MREMTIKFQHPFREKEEELTYINDQKTIESFSDIDWEKLNIDSFENHGDVIHDFYFFEVTYQDNSSLEHTMNIGGAYTYGEDLAKNGPRFNVMYIRPVQRTSKGFLGLGTERTKTIVENVDLPDCTKKTAIECLKAFIDDDQIFLKNIENGGLPWRS